VGTTERQLELLLYMYLPSQSINS